MSTNNNEANIEDDKKPFLPGAIFRASEIAIDTNKRIRLFKLPYEAINLLREGPQETYQHHIVSDSFIQLTGDEYLFLVHFFISPKYIQFYPNNEYVVSNEYTKPYSCVAYFMYDKCIWSSPIYKSLEDFLQDFNLESV